MKKNKIFLVGPRGSGKSTIGKLLSKRLNLDFIDSDELIEKEYKTTISDIVNEKGWSFFRKIEKETLFKICNISHPLVVATGGGIVLDKENRELLKKSGLVFYIKVPVPVLVERLKKDKDLSSRPPLTDLSLEKEVEKVLEEREPLYESVSDYTIDGDKDIDEVVEEIERKSKALFNKF